MRSILLALCIVWTGAAFAQETRYRLERIVVEGSNVSEQIVRGEARLDEEQSYSEEDFRQALYRIRRLPFVTDAVYRIEPGVSAGGTTLVVRILDVMPVYAEVDLLGTRRTDGETVRDGGVLLGGRWLLDNLGVIEGAVRKTEGEEGFLAGLAYRAYDIYGTGGFGSIAVAQRFKAEDRTYDPQVAINLGWPLTQRQTVTLSASRSKSRVIRDFDFNNDDDDDDDDDDDQEDNFDLVDRDRFTFAELRWWYESIDDPFFARRGVSISGGPRYFNTESSAQAFDRTARQIVHTGTKANALGVAVDAAAYRAIFGRTVGFLRLNADGARTDETEVQVVNGAARAGVAFDFHPIAENVLRQYKARVEIGAGYRTANVEGPGTAEFQHDVPFAEAAFVFRSRWGNVRLVGTYETE